MAISAARETEQGRRGGPAGGTSRAKWDPPPGIEVEELGAVSATAGPGRSSGLVIGVLGALVGLGCAGTMLGDGRPEQPAVESAAAVSLTTASSITPARTQPDAVGIEIIEPSAGTVARAPSIHVHLRVDPSIGPLRISAVAGNYEIGAVDAVAGDGGDVVADLAVSAPLFAVPVEVRIMRAGAGAGGEPLRRVTVQLAPAVGVDILSITEAPSDTGRAIRVTGYAPRSLVTIDVRIVDKRGDVLAAGIATVGADDRSWGGALLGAGLFRVDLDVRPSLPAERLFIELRWQPRRAEGTVERLVSRRIIVPSDAVPAPDHETP